MIHIWQARRNIVEAYFIKVLQTFFDELLRTLAGLQHGMRHVDIWCPQHVLCFLAKLRVSCFAERGVTIRRSELRLY